MEVYGKSLIFTVFILILLIVIERIIFKFTNNENKQNKIENFNTIIETTINKMVPFNGDSSSIVTFEGLNFDVIGRIMFVNDVEPDSNGLMAECVILDAERTPTKLKFIPPNLSEFGVDISEVRDKMKFKNEGYKVSIYLVRKDKMGLKSFKPQDKNNFILLPGINFFYIDKIPYANNCPEPKPIPIRKTDFLKTSDETIDLKKNKDLEFVNEILPNQEEKIDKISEKLKSIVEQNKHYQDNDVEYMKTIQALDFLEKYKKNNNTYRYNLHKKINDRYNYNLF